MYLLCEILSRTQYTRPGDNEKDRDRQVYRVFPLEFRVRPPGSIEGLGGKLSVDELLECDGILRLAVVSVLTFRVLGVI